MPITFGSVGDIISLSLLVKAVAKSLDASRGASVEYQTVISELETLDTVILQVEYLFQTCEQTAELNALRVTANQCAEQCRKCILRFREQTKIYHNNLGAESTGGFVKNAGWKIRWSIIEKEKVVDFRAQMVAHSSALGALLTTAGM